MSPGDYKAHEFQKNKPAIGKHGTSKARIGDFTSEYNIYKANIKGAFQRGK